MKAKDTDHKVTSISEKTEAQPNVEGDVGNKDRARFRESLKKRFSGLPNRNRGIYLLPNIVTTGALFAGFFAIIAGMNGDYVQASFSIFVAAALDTADGRVARLTNTESDFGKEYDSLSDLVAFGVAPSLLSFSWGLSTLGKWGWAVAFIYIACAALRLARFNTKDESTSFVGLASPAAACLIGCTIWVWAEFVGGVVSIAAASFLAATLMIVGLLMVSNFLYYSPKQLKFKDRVPFIALVIVIFTFSIILLEPSLVLLFIGITYAVSGPFVYLWKKSKISELGRN